MKAPKFISAGSIPIQVSPRAIAADAAATQNLGNTIAQVGDMGLNLALKLRVADEAAKTEDLFSQFEKEASDFTLGLMTRQDSQNWPTEWSALAEDFRTRATEKGLSPDGLSKFQSRFQDWNTRRTIHLETVAANKSIETARATFENSIDSHLSSQNYEGALTALDNAAAAGLMSEPEKEKARRQIFETENWNNHLEDIRTDPQWLEHNPEPPPGIDEAKYNQLKNFAQSTRSERNRDGSSALLDSIITGHITKPEEIDEQGAALSPTVRHTLKENLARFQSEEYRAQVQSPQGQQAIIGEVSSLIADYDPADPDEADAAYIQIASHIAQLPTDSPIGKELTRQLKAIRTGTWQERDTIQAAAFGALDDAFKAGRFGPPTAEPTAAMPTQKAINDGFLRDKRKLTSLGFSEQQIAELYAPVQLANDKERPANSSDIKSRFQSLWEYRAGTDDKADSFTRATAEAIVQGETDIKDLSPEAAAFRAESLNTTRQTYGKMKTDLANWLTRNPKATEQEITEKVTEFAGAQARASITTSLLKPRPAGARAIPTETSALPAPLKPLVPTFNEAGRTHGIDPRLLAAISMHETGGGKSSAFRNKNNAMGVSNSKGVIAKESHSASINQMARLLSSTTSGPYKNATTLAQIAKIYAPEGAANDPTSLNQHWLAGVSKYYRALGGDPSKPIK